MDNVGEELRSLIERHSRGGRTTTAIPRVGLLRAERTTEPTAGMTELVICLVLQGAKAITCGENVLHHGAGSYFVASVEVPVFGRISEASLQKPFLGVGFSFDASNIADLLIEMPDVHDPEFLCGLGVSPTDNQLEEAFLRMMRLLDRPNEISVMAPMIEREILFRLLRGPQGAKLRQIAQIDGRQSQVRRALAWIRENFTESFKVEDLARMTGMSASVFHRHFKAATTMTPIQYQKRFRLHEARRLLLETRGDAARVAFAVGYESASQFSREYGRLFGLPPARDASRLRAKPIAVVTSDASDDAVTSFGRAI
ncbi:AraC family transcriptional regulator [Rhizobium leguminosarum]|uniref:AraC family transcriptional regulator n=2 Tax=Rhizobium/Agrobacterium group TaxID=227290 RepID=A0A7Y2R0X1_9HYPH|nr:MULTISPECIES: AraC family transcriptional regulator [Rhizobium]MBY5450512.1 AraC family transcriptional regulator [Rhizobium leguminosarum]NNH62257.1 AraC family transcriptional regulator [Rhizobium laguerreae]